MEEWRDIRGYEGLYQVSDWGRVKSFWFGRERIKKPQVLKGGYLQVVLYKNGTEKGFLVHRLVAEAFLPNPKNLPQVDHINTNKRDNRVSNLRWATNDENRKYAVEAGLIKTGEECSWTKLTDEQVQCIRENPEGLTLKQLAEVFGVSPATIGEIQRGETYKNASGSARKAQKRNRLSAASREEIRGLYKPYDREFGTVALAKRFNVSNSTVWLIIREGGG